MTWLKWLVVAVVVIVFGGVAWGQPEGPLVFWHSMSDVKAETLREIIDAYNASNPPLTVREEFVGNYDDLFKKTMSSLLAKRPPDLAMAYESMVAEYMRYRRVADLTPYLAKEDAASVADIFPVFLECNRYPAYDNKLLSMPFIKSVLMQYYNEDLLKAIGRDGPPATWDEFLADCRAIKQKQNITGMAFSRDASTFDGMVFSFGGQVYDSKTRKPLFDQPATVRALTLIRNLFAEGLAKEAAYDSFDDRNDFAQARAGFFIRSSTSRPYVMELVKDRFRWSMAIIPKGKDIPKPRTVLFGPNICMFTSTPQRQEAAWQFIRYFISRDVTAKWATRTGYLPVRKSALDTPALKAFLAQHPANRQSIDAIPFAQSEPSVSGWQKVRTLIEKAVADVIARRRTPKQAAEKLQQEAMRVLTR